MYNVIKILPENLSNKIAAGEIVERPASVVKELVENAVDASSKRITIEIAKGGNSLIRVSDDGIGMRRDDAILALDRYATSKIRTEKDLFSIKTLGFRGEAIPSIASVSKFIMTTKEKDSNVGTKIKVLGGEIQKISFFGTPRGTMVDVKNLFFNTPVRRKFLKSPNTEMSHILDTVTNIALAKPHIKFRFIHNGRIIKDWRTSNSLTSRISNILGSSISKKMFQIKARNKTISVKGFIADPQLNRATTKNIYFFVNGRWVRNKTMLHSLLAAYEGQLMKGKYPIAVIFVTLPHDHVDINVHPQKQEVRFTNSNQVHKILYEVIKKVLNNLNKLKWNTSIKNFNKISNKKVTENISDNLLKTYSHSLKNNKYAKYGTERSNLLKISNLIQHKNENKYFEINKNKLFPLNEVYNKQPSLWKTEFFSDLSIIGQFQQTYLLCEAKNAIIIIDQHAAHERIIFEKLKSDAKKEISSSQRLLIPELIEMDFTNAKTLSKLIPVLDTHGFTIENFGKNTFVVKSVPSSIDSCLIGSLIIKLTKKIELIGNKADIGAITHKCLSVVACHSAVKAGQNLNNIEMKTLLNQLDSCKESSYCPHGRPIWIKIESSYLRKKFNRTK